LCGKGTEKVKNEKGSVRSKGSSGRMTGATGREGKSKKSFLVIFDKKVKRGRGLTK